MWNGLKEEKEGRNVYITISQIKIKACYLLQSK